MEKTMQIKSLGLRFRNLLFMLSFLLLFSCAPEKSKDVTIKTEDKPMRAGGWADASITDEWVTKAAEFAVKGEQEVMRMTESQKTVTLKLVKIISAKQQVVAGMNYDLKLEVNMDGKTKTARTILWRQLSGKFKLTSWNWE